MGKTKATSSSERAFGRIALSDLTDARVAEWSVRAVAGDRRQFSRDAQSAATTTTAAQGEQDAVERRAIQVSLLQEGTKKLVGMRCGTCDIAAFESLQEQHAHFKTEWHCLNLKRKAKGLSIFTSEEEANDSQQQKKTKNDGNAKQDGGYASSASSSSSDASEIEDVDDVYTTTEPVVEFSDGKSVFKVYKNILPYADTEKFNPYTSLDEIRNSKFKWAVFLLRSGRFAGAIFDGEKALCHKTFQRYTVRRKQGGSQSASDNAGGKAKSAGATLRRYNETALKQDVADLLAQWSDLLKGTELIFLSSGKSDRATFFAEKPPVLQSDDPRLRRIPFATFRPTFEEVCRVRSDLSSIRFSPLTAESASPSEKSKKAVASKAKKSSAQQENETKRDLSAIAEEEKKEEVIEEVVVPLLIQLVLEGDVSKVKALELVPGSDDSDVNVVDANFMTALHHASASDSVPLVTYLLDNGANPSLLDLRNRPPYFLCSTKETRNAFRRFLADHPDEWDYTASQIPTALTSDMEQKKKEKEAEKRRRAKERKKQQKKDAAEAEQRERARQEEEERQIAAGKACDCCGKYAGKTPFLRLEYKYCSTECVNVHKRKLMSEAALRRFGGS
uniref:VLRF1 domain-containing protein n=1 Tax=Globisporangium ultimum (strain ATCC 200006 / CBS 805.95 / DAOM BR144) TaxID=431595 RepID=K3WKI9_GLOUD